MAHSVSAPPELYWAQQLQLHFEIYVDGVLRAQSGLMSVRDAPRTLVASGLDDAKELRLKCRLHNDGELGPKWPSSGPQIGCWGNPELYRK